MLSGRPLCAHFYALILLFSSPHTYHTTTTILCHLRSLCSSSNLSSTTFFSPFFQGDFLSSYWFFLNEKNSCQDKVLLYARNSCVFCNLIFTYHKCILASHFSKHFFTKTCKKPTPQRSTKNQIGVGKPAPKLINCVLEMFGANTFHVIHGTPR